MSLKKYIIDKIPFLVLNIIVFLFCSIMLKVSNSTPILIVLLAFVWFMPIFIFMMFDFFTKKRFYSEIITLTNKLDKKYLLPEVINRPSSYEGQLIYDVLEECNRAMHEHVNEYKIMQSEYREYIETWVHEIKTPIALTKLVAENSEGKTKTIIQNETKKIEGYVEQVLYYSRSTDVNKDYLIKEFEIKDILNKVIRNNRFELINEHFQIDLENVTGKVITDEKWLEFIINQIIINAIKYKKEHNAQLKAYTILTKDKLILTIEDNGIGIIAKDVDRVFEKGFTGYNGRIYGRSTGIGLYLCKKLCLKLGLNITLTSEYDKGTKVNLVFPLGYLTHLHK